ILNHEPVPYFKVEAQFATKDHEYAATWFDPNFKRKDAGPDDREDRIFNKELVEKILREIENQPAKASETRKPKPRKPPVLFDLRSLRREANGRFGWAAVRTLRAAQRCYEAHKVLTYPRTSSKALPEDYRGPVNDLLQTLSGTATYGRHAKYL